MTGGRVRTVLAVTVALVATACSHDVSVAPPTASRLDAEARTELAQRSLDRLSASVQDQSVEALPSGVPVGGLAATVVENARRLGVRRLGLRDTGVEAGDSSAVREQYGARAWAQEVAVSFRLPGDDEGTEIDTAAVFTPAGGGEPARLVATGGLGLRGVLWLQRPVQVRRGPQALLVTAGGPSDRWYWTLTRQAVRDVRRVLPRWRRVLVVEVPADREELEQNLAARPGSYRLLAGVTGAVADDPTSRSPLHSFFNPEQLARLGPRSARVVASHEATLQATRGPLTPAPIWATEGFADYVPLLSAGVSQRTAAKEIDGQVLRDGPPDHLPTRRDFDPTSTDLDRLNAVYESAWLACRYVARHWGRHTLLALYRALERDDPTAFSSVLGLGQARFVTGWRDYLVRTARADHQLS